jgi:hypothetical protein
MRVQRPRTDPMPLGWELPLLGMLCWAVGAALLLPVAQGLAALLFGGGAAWPTHALLPSLVGLLRGHPGVGLPARQAALLQHAFWVYAVAAIVEVGWLYVGALGLVKWWRALGPGIRHGMASRRECESVLGLSNLRRRRRIIRPDLYGTDSQRPSSHGRWRSRLRKGQNREAPL